MAERPDHPKKRKLAVIDLEKCTYCGACMEACKKFNAIEMEVDKADAGINKDDYRDVWVFAEQRHHELSTVSFELLNEGRLLAGKLNAGLCAILIGSKAGGMPQELIYHGADRVYVIENDMFGEFREDSYSSVLSDLIEKKKPEVVLMGATNIGRSFASRVAAKIQTGLTADCTGLDIEPGTRNLLQTRPAFGGNIMATILTPNHRPQMATVRHKVFKQSPRDTGRKGEVEKVEIDTGKLKARTKFLKYVADTSAKVNLAEADIIVSGGRGLGKPEGFKLVEELAAAIGGAVGSSRAAVDAGWIPYSHQVGQTGRTVAPRIYVACGISGQIQHLVGMSSADVIVAINKDPDCPMMKIATFAIEGDVYEVIPSLVNELKKTRGA